MSELANQLLAKPVGKTLVRQGEKELTRQVEISDDKAQVVINAPTEVEMGQGVLVLEEYGLNPGDWEISGFKASEWTMSNGERGISTKFTFGKKKFAEVERVSIDELVPLVENYHATGRGLIPGTHGFIVALGDMQFGKIDGDGPAGTLARTIKAINLAADRLVEYSRRFHIGHVHIAWLGDHIEGFVSQGGANVFRTTLTLNEQIRLTRRVMLHALTTFAPLTTKLTMAAVPGNHGEAVRFMGKGVTRYDDSHDTESLIAVKDAADLSEKFGHVEFYVPHTDELIVMADVAGTKVAHHHGHSWRPGKQFEWWAKQSLNRESPLHMADLLVAGHLHHEHFETDGTRDYWGINALESESTWYRHTAGSGGSPGIHVGITRDGQTTVREAIKL